MVDDQRELLETVSVCVPMDIMVTTVKTLQAVPQDQMGRCVKMVDRYQDSAVNVSVVA